MESLFRGMTRALPTAGFCAALAHFLKVTRSYWDGLFHCYDVPDLPATNNDLEQLFGAYRHYERRERAQKVASSTVVVRGKVRIVTATATRIRRSEATKLAPADLDAWQALRRDLEGRQGLRVLGQRCRKKRRAYLRRLENLLNSAYRP